MIYSPELGMFSYIYNKTYIYIKSLSTIEMIYETHKIAYYRYDIDKYEFWRDRHFSITVE